MRTRFSTIGSLFAILTLIAAVVAADESKDTLKIWDDSDKYKFYGCYNETTNIEGSAQTRALNDGINEVKKGEMTVPMCLAFCSGGRTEYRYAGLEYSRECWCGQVLAGIAAKLDDEECSFPCDGDNSTACGGALKLSVYRIDSSMASGISASNAWAAFGVVLTLLLQSI